MLKVTLAFYSLMLNTACNCLSLQMAVASWRPRRESDRKCHYFVVNCITEELSHRAVTHTNLVRIWTATCREALGTNDMVDYHKIYLIIVESSQMHSEWQMRPEPCGLFFSIILIWIAWKQFSQNIMQLHEILYHNILCVCSIDRSIQMKN